MNANFRQLVTWVEGKVGLVGQPFVIPANSVSTGNIVDGGVTAADLAANAVETAALADGAVTAAKLASRVPVYTRAADCSNAGEITFASICTYTSAQCGTCNIIATVPRYENCAGFCAPCNSSPLLSAQSCPAANSLRGYLVGP